MSSQCGSGQVCCSATGNHFASSTETAKVAATVRAKTLLSRASDYAV